MSCRGSAATSRCDSAQAHIVVDPAYLPSEKAGGQHWFAYHITVHNQGDCAFKLLARYWRITDDNGQVREVSGAGVIGKQPLLAPGDSFSYTSYVNFSTPLGFMEGHYVLQLPGGEQFRARIALFSLAVKAVN